VHGRWKLLIYLKYEGLPSDSHRECNTRKCLGLSGVLSNSFPRSPPILAYKFISVEIHFWLLCHFGFVFVLVRVHPYSDVCGICESSFRYRVEIPVSAEFPRGG